MQKFLSIFFILFSLPGFALEGFHFEHKDWEIACDNIGTCRMLGYGYSDTSESEPIPVALLFVREIDETPVKGFVKLGFDLGLEQENAKQIDKDNLQLWLNGSLLGKLNWQEDFIFQLSEAQTKALLEVLNSTPDIKIRNKQKSWWVSFQGATSVMLKMDEFQQRLNTPTALVQKGMNNRPIFVPQPVPTIKRLNPLMKNSSWVVEQILEENPRYRSLLALLKKAIPEDECSSLGAEGNSISVQQLSAERKLVGSWCNDDSLLYVLTDSAEKQVFWHSTDYTEFQEGKLYGIYRMRVLGDCWLGKEAVWNGEQFIKSDEFSTGQCRGFNEGSWMLPTLVSEVIE